MHNKTKKNDHRRENKHIRKEWHNFVHEVENLSEEEVDFYVEKTIRQNSPIQNYI